MTGRFGSVITAMITPFDDNGALDIDGAVRLAKWLVDHGNDGLVLAGTTGEAPVLTDPERLTLIEAVTQAVTVPVIAGTGTNDTPHSVHMTKSVLSMGVAGILAVCPYYNRPSQAGIAAHMRAIADAAAGLPVVVYDIPVRSGRKIATATLLDLARTTSNIVALKDAAGNPAETARVIAEAPAGFEVYSGDDGLTLPLLAVGAVGVIGVATHWSGVEHSEMMKLWFKGDTEGARAVNARLLESFAYETGDDAPNPLPTKAMMRVMGLPAGQCRLPMGDAPDWLEPRAREVLAALSS
jgi:4-hydroxy-tetrahydrodipicolinate synthase